MTYYIDGFSSPTRNGYLICDENSNEIAYKEFIAITLTSNEAEYEGLKACLDIAIEGSTIHTDSQLLVGQVAGTWRVRAQHLRGYVDYCKKLLTKKRITLTWVSREQNLAGQLVECK